MLWWKGIFFSKYFGSKCKGTFIDEAYAVLLNDKKSIFEPLLTASIWAGPEGCNVYQTYLTQPTLYEE